MAAQKSGTQTKTRAKASDDHDYLGLPFGDNGALDEAFEENVRRRCAEQEDEF